MPKTISLIIMIRLVNYCNNLFPSVDTETKNAIRDFVKQINLDNTSWFMTNLLSELSQGDILNKIPFVITDDEGKQKVYLAKGMILSNTCDLARDPYIIIAPLFNINEGNFNKQQKRDLKDNVYSAKMGFKNSCLDNYFVDFSKSMSFNRKIILKGIELNKIKREHSLSQLAWYMLLIKITIYYMRVENHEWFKSRDKGI